MGTSLDDFLEIDAIIGGIIFYGFADHLLHSVIGATVEEKTRAWWHQVHKQGFHTLKSLLGTSGVIQVQSKLRGSKFIQMEE